MGITLLFFSCSQYDDISSQNIEASTEFSGEEIFKGLFFFQNDIANNISDLKEIKSKIESLDDSNKIASSLSDLSNISISYIKENYPKFFDDLKITMNSGNLYEIEKKMNLSAKIIEQSMLTSEKYSKIFAINNAVEKNPELLQRITELDLTKEKDLSQLKQIIRDNQIDIGDVESTLVFFAAALAVFYVGAIAVSIAAVLYSVVTKAAYWDPTEKLAESQKIAFSEESTISRELMIAEIGKYFSEQ